MRRAKGNVLAMSTKERAALEALVRTATTVHQISHRTHDAWRDLTTALEAARAVLDETPAPLTSNERSTDPVFLADCLRRLCAPPGWTLDELCQWAAERIAAETEGKPVSSPQHPCICREYIGDALKIEDGCPVHSSLKS